MLACAGVLGVVTGPGVAYAASDQIGTSPAGDVVARAPFAVSVTFDRPLREGSARIEVISPAGDVGTGPITTADRTLRRELKSGAPGGAYVVTWSAVSADGEPVEGVFRFIAARANAEPALPALSSPSPGRSGPRPAATGFDIAATPTMASPSKAAAVPPSKSDAGFTLVPLTLGAVLVVAAGVVSVLNKRRERAAP